MKSGTLISSIACLLALTSHGALAQTVPSSSGASPSDGAPFVVPRSKVHLLPSMIVDQVYELRVSVPEDYGNDDGLRPVVYALDGQWNFNLMSDIVGKLSYDGSIPDPIVVAITWAGAGDQPALRGSTAFPLAHRRRTRAPLPPAPSTRPCRLIERPTPARRSEVPAAASYSAGRRERGMQHAPQPDAQGEERAETEQ